MKRLIATLLLIAVVTPLHADADFDRLRTFYEAAVEKAVAPIKATYTAQLKQLADLRRRAGQEEAAALIELEINRLGGAGGPAVPHKRQVVVTEDMTERFSMGTTWVTVSGAEYTFEKAGKGTRKFQGKSSSLVWRVAQPGVIEVVAEKGDGKVGNVYFRFLSRNEGFYGDTPTNTDKKLATK